MVGKWHLGARHVNHFPHNRRFDDFLGHMGQDIYYYTHLNRGAKDWQRNGVTVRQEGYSRHLLTEEAVRMIETREADRPF